MKSKKRKTTKLVQEIEILYVIFFWSIFFAIIVYGFFDQRLSPLLMVVSNSFNFFILPYLIGLAYMFRSKKVKQEICKKKSINIATDNMISKLMRMHFWIIGSYFIVAIIGNIFEFIWIDTTMMETFFVCFMCVAMVFIGTFMLNHHLFYVTFSICSSKRNHKGE
ncbi:hypothetical protein [Sulfurimonas sp.]|uniref:hypothetical protein n=1 Tax=Sulfurimonas sp. TaxID=2022749 RepID=UPI003D136AB0